MHHALERTDQLPATAEEWKYLPAWQVRSWPLIWQALTGSRTTRDTERIHEIYRHRLHLVTELHRAGVRLMAGTDTGTGYLVPGFSLHGELELLAEAGLSPYDVLRTATANPTRLLGLPRDAADLVILDPNPLRDIRHTRRIDAVVSAGRFIGGQERARLLAAVANAASRSEPPQGPTVVRTARCC
ncbi:amidohydrolase family protein [Streptomyces sp. A5-4]|uniref:amidohydrolase family protein n=1 Tax=Streptomyces sp. A5-4 TaxID=3384771 RepID=UPI003DA811A7